MTSTETRAVSIVILTYNNPAILRQCIESALKLEYPNFRVFVVDNASTDDTAEVVRNEFPDVTLVSCEVNSPTSARNRGFWAADGEFVLSLDHDMILPDPEFLTRGVEFFDAFPAVGVLSPKICSVESPDQPLASHWWYPTPIEARDEHFLTTYFPEGAVFFRADALRASGGYDERFFHVAENIDLALKIMRLGWQILYCPSISTIELVVSGHLSQRRSPSNEYVMRNRLWVAWKHYPWFMALKFAVPRIVKSGALSVRYRWLDYYLAGLRQGVFAPAEVRADRQVMGPEQWAEINAIEGTRVTAPRASAES